MEIIRRKDGMHITLYKHNTNTKRTDRLATFKLIEGGELKVLFQNLTDELRLFIGASPLWTRTTEWRPPWLHWMIRTLSVTAIVGVQFLLNIWII